MGWFSVTGASAVNPVTKCHITRPGGTSGELTPQFKSFLFRYPVARWMNGLPINNNVADLTAADIPDAGNSFITAYDDVLHWANQSPMLRKVWINIPIGADSSYIVTVAKKCSDSLSAGKQVIVELSNEVWNAGFQQFFYAMDKGRADSRVSSTDDFGKVGEEYGIMAGRMMQIFRSQFTDKSRVEGFLGSQGTNTYFADKAKTAIQKYYGAPNTLFKYQGISLYPCDGLTGSGSKDDLISQINADMARVAKALSDDRADAKASGLIEAVYEWSINGYLTRGGVGDAVVSAYRADSASYRQVLQLWNIINTGADSGEIAMNFDMLGDGWGPQIDPFGPTEFEQEALQTITDKIQPVTGAGSAVIKMARSFPAQRSVRLYDPAGRFVGEIRARASQLARHNASSLRFLAKGVYFATGRGADNLKQNSVLYVR
jgi:hypothetical protein